MADNEHRRKLTAFAREMRKAPSDAEQKLWQSLRRNQLDGLYFRRQKPIGPFIADFVCESCGLIVEVDGEQHSANESYDEDRTQFLNKEGWRVIRFSASAVMRDHDAVLETILRECRSGGGSNERFE